MAAVSCASLLVLMVAAGIAAQWWGGGDASLAWLSSGGTGSIPSLSDPSASSPSERGAPLPGVPDARKRGGEGEAWPVFRLGSSGGGGGGCSPDGASDCTEELRGILAACGAAGGGTVVVPQGRWLIAPVTLVSNLHLSLEAPGSILVAVASHYGFSDPRWPQIPWKEYPLAPSYTPHPRHVALLNGHSLRNVSIVGPGTIDGNGSKWWGTDNLHGDGLHEKITPELIHLVAVSGLKVEGVTLVRSPSYTLHPQFCRDVLIAGVTIRNHIESHSTNGIVLDSCERCHVVDSVVDTGKKEDAIVVKSGKDWLGRERNRPSKDILVERCKIYNGHAISVGSEMSGGVFNVTFRDVEFDGRHSGGFGAGSVRIKSQRGRGGTVDGVTFENIHGHEAIYGVEFYMFYSKKPNVPTNATGTPKIRNIVVRNMRIDGVTRHAGVIAGLPEMPIEGLVLDDIHIKHLHKGKKGGWDCRKFKECTWSEGGCARGRVSDVSPGLPKGCVAGE